MKTQRAFSSFLWDLVYKQRELSITKTIQTTQCNDKKLLEIYHIEQRAADSP